MVAISHFALDKKYWALEASERREYQQQLDFAEEMLGEGGATGTLSRY